MFEHLAKNEELKIDLEELTNIPPTEDSNDSEIPNTSTEQPVEAPKPKTPEELQSEIEALKAELAKKAEVKKEEPKLELPPKPIPAKDRVIKKYEKALEEGQISQEQLNQYLEANADLLAQLDEAETKKWELECETLKLKSAPEVKDLQIKKEITAEVETNLNSWVQEFEMYFPKMEEIEQLSPEKQEELVTYISEISLKTLFDAKKNGRAIINPLILRQTDILNKINNLKRNGKTETTKATTIDINSKKQAASVSSGGVSTNIAPKTPKFFNHLLDVNFEQD